MSDTREHKPRSPRMTGRERREQLIRVGRELFATRGFDGTSVEEIAAKARVSKPIIYEHFGGKEGLYAVIVDRETQSLLGALETSLEDAKQHPRVLLERAALAFLTYIEEHENGFHILVRDSPAPQGSGTYSSLLVDIASQVEHLLMRQMGLSGFNTDHAVMYSQMLVGIVSFTGQWWLESKSPSKEIVASHIVNLAWHGLKGLSPEPHLVTRRGKERS